MIFAEQITQVQETQTLFSFTNVMLGLFGFLLLVGGAILVLMSKRKDTLGETNEKIIKARDTELVDIGKKCTKCQEELEDITVEYRALASINLKDLFEYWQVREREIAKAQTLESQNRVLSLRLGDKDV